MVPPLNCRVPLSWVLQAARSPLLASLASPSKPTLQVNSQMSHLALFIPFLPIPPHIHPSFQFPHFPILDKHQQPWSGPAPPTHLSLSHHTPSSAPAPAPGTFSCPVAAVPWFSSLHHPLQFLCLLPCTISSVLTAVVAAGTYRSIATMEPGPTKPEGNHSLLLIGT